MKNGDPIFHTVHKVRGILTATPRAHGTHVRCRLADNSSSSYYLRSEIQLVESDGSLGAMATTTPAPETPPPVVVNGHNEPRGVFTPVPPDGAPAISLAELNTLRRDLLAAVERIDGHLLRLRVDDAVTSALRKVQLSPAILTPAPAKPILSAEAEKIRRDTAQALDAAKRLSARGAL